MKTSKRWSVRWLCFSSIALLSKGGKNIRVEEKVKEEIKYWMSLSIIRDLYEKGLVDLEILEKLNIKNARTFGCKVVPITK